MTTSSHANEGINDFVTISGRYDSNDRYDNRSNDNDASPRKVMKPAIKISKRVNARLQLAAALIEADNDELERKYQETYEEYKQTQISQTGLPGEIGPPPIPKPKLASDSVIFHRYRQGGVGFEETEGLDYEGRPVIDFLGMQLPHEKRLSSSSYYTSRGDDGNNDVRIWKSRPLSSRGTGPWTSRPNSISNGLVPSSQSISAGSMRRTFSAPSIPEERQDDNLEEWGVKFLSSEAREQIETERKSRASSALEQERPKSAQSNASIAGAKAMSETGTRASDARDSPADLNDPSKADWLAKIRQYREAQDAGESKGEGEETITAEKPGASAPTMVVDLESSSQDKSWKNQLRALDSSDERSIRGKSPAKEIAIDTRSGPANSEWRRSNAGIVGDSWSEEGDEISEKSASLSSAAPSPLKDRRMHLKGREQNRDFIGQPNFLPMGDVPLLKDQDQYAGGMTGIGSYSRSPSSRRNSLTMSSQLLQQPDTINRAKSVSPGASYVPSLSPVGQQFDSGRPVAMTYLPVPGQVRGKPKDTAPKRSSLLNPISPRLAPTTPEATLAAIDPFPELTSVGFSRYPTLASPTINAIDSMMGLQNFGPPTPNTDSKKRVRPTSMAGLSTKQLQEMAKMAVLPAAMMNVDDYNVDCGLPLEDAKLLETEQAIFEAEEMESNIASTLETLEAKSKKKEFPSIFSKVKEGKSSTVEVKEKAKAKEIPKCASQKEEEERQSQIEDHKLSDDGRAQELPVRIEPLETFFGANEEADLSSARWGKKRRTNTLADKIKKRLSESIANTLSSQHLSGTSEDLMLPPSSDDVDDEYTSPPTKGPLRPRGIEARLPPAIKMPLPLNGTSLAPRKRLTADPGQLFASRSTSLHVPDGFVLHHRLDGASTKALRVQGAAANKPFFSSKKEKDENGGAVREFMKSSRSSRMIAVPVAAPDGIGRRAAMRSTALFRNQLVQHDEEKEGWGWEAGSCIGAAQSEDYTEEEMNQVSVVSKNAKSRKEMKKEEKLKKAKLKRKEARRARREKRELALSRGLTYEEAGVEKWSPDEDADLSESSSDSCSSESEKAVSERSVQGEGEEEVRRRDEKKPAGLLYGKSLLDVVDERKQKATSKARQYGQISGDTEDGDIRSIVASSIEGHSFRENPIGFNDTKERMEAAFGPDPLWAKEMAKRKLLDAKEEEERAAARKASEAEAAIIAAKKKAKEEKRSTFRLGRRSKGRKAENMESTEIRPVSIDLTEGAREVVRMNPDIPSIDINNVGEEEEELQRLSSQTSHDPPKIQLNLAQNMPLSRKSSNRSGPAASWYEGPEDGDDDDASDDSEREAARRREELMRKRLSRSLGGKGLKEEAERLYGEDSDEEEEEDEEEEDTSSSEDDIPLSSLRRTLPKSLSISRLRLDEQDSDEEEDLPLSKLVDVRKQREQTMGHLDLDFHLQRQSKADPDGGGEKEAEDSESSYEDCDDDDEDDEPIGKRVLGSQVPMQNVMTNLIISSNDSDDDDNLPLGAAHPQAAVIAEQANMIKNLQEEIGLQRRDQMQQQQTAMIMYPPSTPFGFMPPPMAFHPGVLNPALSMPMLMPPPAPQPMFAPFPPQEVDNSIVNWASQVSPNDPASIPHSRDNSSG